MPNSAEVVLCTCPDMDSARRIADALLDQRLAACVNILPGVTSRYRWQGTVEESSETLLLIKTTRARYPTLERTLVSLHPYELPEIIGVPVEQGLAGYLAWIETCTKTTS